MLQLFPKKWLQLLHWVLEVEVFILHLAKLLRWFSEELQHSALKRESENEQVTCCPLAAHRSVNALLFAWFWPLFSITKAFNLIKLDAPSARSSSLDVLDGTPQPKRFLLYYWWKSLMGLRIWSVSLFCCSINGVWLIHLIVSIAWHGTTSVQPYLYHYGIAWPTSTRILHELCCDHILYTWYDVELFSDLIVCYSLFLYLKSIFWTFVAISVRTMLCIPTRVSSLEWLGRWDICFRHQHAGCTRPVSVCLPLFSAFPNLKIVYVLVK
jgi:hypothetical protein